MGWSDKQFCLSSSVTLTSFLYNLTKFILGLNKKTFLEFSSQPFILCLFVPPVFENLGYEMFWKYSLSTRRLSFVLPYFRFFICLKLQWNSGVKQKSPVCSFSFFVMPLFFLPLSSVFIWLRHFNHYVSVCACLIKPAEQEQKLTSGRSWAFTARSCSLTFQ